MSATMRMEHEHIKDQINKFFSTYHRDSVCYIMKNFIDIKSKDDFAFISQPRDSSHVDDDYRFDSVKLEDIDFKACTDRYVIVYIHDLEIIYTWIRSLKLKNHYSANIDPSVFKPVVYNGYKFLIIVPTDVETMMRIANNQAINLQVFDHMFRSLCYSFMNHAYVYPSLKVVVMYILRLLDEIHITQHKELVL